MKKIDPENLPPILQDYAKYIGEFSKGGRESYLYRLFMLKEFLERRAKSLEGLQRNDLVDYFAYLRDRGCSKNTIHNVASIARVFAKWLKVERKLDSEEYEKIEEFTKKQRISKDAVLKRESLSKEETEKIYGILVDPLLRFIFWFGINFGLRRTELCDTKISDINFERMCIVVRKGKGDKAREIPMIKKQADPLKQMLDLRSALPIPHDYLFYNTRFGRPDKDSLQLCMEKISGVTGIYVHCHKLRYTFATNLWRNGMDIFLISKALGHESIETTMRYLLVSDEEIHQRYVESLQKIYDRGDWISAA